MAPPAEKKKKFSSADHRLIFSAAIGENQQKSLGSVVTSLGKRQSVRVATKMNRRWICTDVWMDMFPFFDRPQLGLKLAMLSPRFNVLVDAHFNGRSELTIWKEITIRKMGTTTKLVVKNSNVNSVPFPLPDRPLPNKIRFNFIQIAYIDHSVITFLRSNQQIFEKGTNLDVFVPLSYKANVQPFWDVFAREILPLFATNIRHLNFADGHHLNNLLRLISPTFLTALNQLNSIDASDLFTDGIGHFDGPNAPSVGQALFEWLHTPTKDGQPKRLCCRNDGTRNFYKWATTFKEPFLRATTSVCFKIRLEFFESTEIGPFELVNERTNEMLKLEKEENDHEYIIWVLERCQIGETIQWEDKKTDNLNNVDFMIFEFGPLSPPKTGQKNANYRLKMNAGPSGQRKKK